jgi:ATP-dependent helicase YprA (DUF1998 family)
MGPSEPVVFLFSSEHAGAVDEKAEVRRAESVACFLITVPDSPPRAENLLKKAPNVIVPELNEGALCAAHVWRSAMHSSDQRDEHIGLILLSNSKQRFKVVLATFRVEIAMRYECFHVSTADGNLFFVLEGCRKIRFQFQMG